MMNVIFCGRSKQKLNSAFSLIELMVVIAIVAILASLAVPAYRNYVIKARLNGIVVPLVEDLTRKSILIAQQKGYFGNAYHLGLTSSPSNPVYNASTVDNPINRFGSYFTNGLFWIGDQSNGCGASNTVQGYLNPTTLGFDPSVVNSFQFGCSTRHYNGIFTTKCWYTYGTNPGTGVSQTAQLIPGWINSNATSGWDASNWNNGNAWTAPSNCM